MRVFDHHNLTAIDNSEPAPPEGKSNRRNKDAETWHVLPACKRCGFSKVVNGACRVCALRERYRRHVQSYQRRWPRGAA